MRWESAVFLLENATKEGEGELWMSVLLAEVQLKNRGRSAIVFIENQPERKIKLW